MELYMTIADTIFSLSLDNNIRKYFIDRVSNLDSNPTRKADVKVICDRRDDVPFTNEKFIHQQEPDISAEFFYREILDLGVFEYDRNEKVLKALYVDTDKYPFDSFEVVVDTLLQFIYLIMLDFEIIPLHASVISYQNKAILLFGNSGSGKTTLEIALLHSGFRFFADDIAFVDEKRLIHSSGEHVIACLHNTVNMINDNFNNNLIGAKYCDVTRKIIFNVEDNWISGNSELVPFMLIFPTLSTDESLEKMSAKSAFVELIELSVSKQFSVSHKQQYMKCLKELSESTIAVRYNRTNNNVNKIKEICSKIKTCCETSEVYS